MIPASASSPAVFTEGHERRTHPARRPPAVAAGRCGRDPRWEVFVTDGLFGVGRLIRVRR
jgi:hypothetical protein